MAIPRPESDFRELAFNTPYYYYNKVFLPACALLHMTLLRRTDTRQCCCYVQQVVIGLVDVS
jgi:hypothetical protein